MVQKHLLGFSLFLWLLSLLAFAGQPPEPNRLAQGRQEISQLPPLARAGISTAIGRDQTAYHGRNEAGKLRFDNPGHRLTARFTRDGAEVESAGNSFYLRFAGLGRGDKRVSPSSAQPHATANRVEFRRGDLTEWYVNGPLGLEQGFTVEKPPAQTNRGDLSVALTLSGELQPRSTADGLDLVRADGTAILHYGGLAAWDSDGRSLPVSWEKHDKEIRFRLDDTRARYPVTIDPYIQQAKLVAADGLRGDAFGNAVAIDGNTVVAGAVYDNSAYVFVKPTTGWSGTLQHNAKLVPSDGASFSLFGNSVAINGDTIVVGDLGANSAQGSAFVFSKPAGGWAGTLSESGKLEASDGVRDDRFGSIVAMTANEIFVGSPQHDVEGRNDQGAVYVFHKPVAGWSESISETSKLVASDGEEGDFFGYVAVSGDTVVVGAFSANGNKGAAYLFIRPAGGWDGTLTEVAKLTASDGEAGDNFGAVAISGDTVVSGADSDDIETRTDQGSAYIFERPVTGWSGLMTETAKVVASDGASNDKAGISAISGNTVVLGARKFRTGGTGAAYIFEKPSSGWAGIVAETQKLLAADGSPGNAFGESVAVGSGSIVVGASHHYSGSVDGTDGTIGPGAAYIFAHGTSPGSTGTISLSTALLDFGSVAPNQFATLQLTVSNTGTGDLQISAITEPAAPFSKLNDSCSGQTLAAGGSCKLNFRFAPTANGEVSSSVDISSNDSANAMVTVTLTGTGSDTPLPLQFDSLSSGDLGAGGELTLSGHGFTTAKGKLLIGPKRAKVVTWSDSSIAAKLPVLAAGSYPVKIVTRRNGSADASTVNVHAPAVDAVSSSTAAAGDTVTVSGRYFGRSKPKVFLVSGRKRRATAVLPGFTDGAAEIRLPRRIKAGTYQVTVRSSAGSSTEAVTLTIQ